MDNNGKQTVARFKFPKSITISNLYGQWKRSHKSKSKSKRMNNKSEEKIENDSVAQFKCCYLRRPNKIVWWYSGTAVFQMFNYTMYLIQVYATTVHTYTHSLFVAIQCLSLHSMVNAYHIKQCDIICVGVKKTIYVKRISVNIFNFRIKSINVNNVRLN